VALVLAYAGEKAVATSAAELLRARGVLVGEAWDEHRARCSWLAPLLARRLRLVLVHLSLVVVDARLQADPPRHGAELADRSTLYEVRHLCVPERNVGMVVPMVREQVGQFELGVHCAAALDVQLAPVRDRLLPLKRGAIMATAVRVGVVLATRGARRSRDVSPGCHCHREFSSSFFFFCFLGHSPDESPGCYINPEF
jgi:hypothetical protein